MRDIRMSVDHRGTPVGTRAKRGGKNGVRQSLIAMLDGWKDIVISSGQKKRPPTVSKQFRGQVAIL
eukprot:1319098-Amorphochlora_amoeboformis.AAC.1